MKTMLTNFLWRIRGFDGAPKPLNQTKTLLDEMCQIISYDEMLENHNL